MPTLEEQFRKNKAGTEFQNLQGETSTLEQITNSGLDISKIPEISQTSNTISSDDLQPVDDINIPTDTGDESSTVLTPVPDIQETDKGSEATDLYKKITETLGDLSESQKYESRLKGDESGTYAKNKALEAQYLGEYNALVAAHQAVPINIQNEFAGRGATAGGVASIQRERQRDIAVKALTTKSLLQMARGNMAAALDTIEEKVKAKYGDAEATLKIQQAQLDALNALPDLTAEEKQRAEERQNIIDENKAILEEKKADETAKETVVLEAISAGADDITVRNIRNAKDQFEAAQIMADYTAKAQAQELAQSANLDTAVSSLVSQGYTDAGEILSALNFDAQGNPTGVNATIEDVQPVVDKYLEGQKTKADIRKTEADIRDVEGNIITDNLKREEIRINIENKNLENLKLLNELNNIGNEVGIENLEFGTPEYAQAIISNSSKFNDKTLVGAQLEKVQQALTALSGLETVNSLLAQGEDGLNLTGPVKGRTRRFLTMLGSDADAAAINAAIQGLIPTVARGIFGEVGVLTNADIENYKKTLPNLTSSDEQNRLVSLIMLDVLKNTFTNVLVTNAQNQTNVSGFLPAYNNVIARVEQERKNLGVTEFSGVDTETFLESIPEDASADILNDNLFNQTFNNFMQ